jgi:RNA polymerase sigma-70 factor (ECF subfamily)
MPRRDETSMGGPNREFLGTPWTEILRARTDDDARRREALGRILARYWKPLYCYLRRRGHSNEEAKDLVQGFCEEVVLGRRLVAQADRAKGRFRTFLLTALCHYVASVRRAETARKRLPEDGLVRLDTSDAPDVPEPTGAGSPEDAFHYAWAAALLDEVLAEVREACLREGKALHWEIFRARLLAPIMEDAEPPSLADLCARHGIADEDAASNMTITVKRRFEAALTRHVRELVETDADVAGEIRELMEILSRGGARS